MKKIKFYITFIIIFLIIIFTIPAIAEANSDIKVLLDPGHGGYDSGAVNRGLYEKDITWKIATKVKAILDNTNGITGILSRSENTCPEIVQRGDMANNMRC